MLVQRLQTQILMLVITLQVKGRQRQQNPVSEGVCVNPSEMMPGGGNTPEAPIPRRVALRHCSSAVPLGLSNAFWLI